MSGLIDITTRVPAAKADSGITDNTQIINDALLEAQRTGARGIWVPPALDGKFYGITSHINALDNVGVFGAGYRSFIKNTTAVDDNTGKVIMLRLGGYEGIPQLAPHSELKFSCEDAWAGSNTLVLKPDTPGTSSARISAGAVLFISTTAHEDLPGVDSAGNPIVQKEMPFYQEMNRVAGIEGRLIHLEEPLLNDYRACNCYLSGSGLKGFKPGQPQGMEYVGLPVRAVQNFTMQGLRLEVEPRNPADADSKGVGYNVFGFGGAYRCTFRDLWITQTADLMQMNGTSRCLWENIFVRYSRGMGELAWYCVDNKFFNVRGVFRPIAGVAPATGMLLTEGASDNLFSECDLDHGDAGTVALLFGNGKRNRWRGGRIVATRVSAANGLSPVTIAAPERIFKSKDCSIEDARIRVGRPDGSGAPYFAVEIDSGGPQGGECVARNLIIEGWTLFGSVGLTRRDKERNHPSNQPCAGNLVEGITHIPSDILGVVRVPPTSGVVEHTHAEANVGVQALIDPSWRPGDNVVRDIQAYPTQRRVEENGGERVTATGPNPTRVYTIPMQSVGTRHAWLIEAQGRVDAADVNSAKSVRFSANGTLAGAGIDFAAGQSFTWGLRVWLVGVASGDRALPTGQSVVANKQLLWEYTKGSTVTRGHTPLPFDSNAQALELRLQLWTTSSGQGIWLDRWAVTPHGDDFSSVNYALAKQLWGV